MSLRGFWSLYERINPSENKVKNVQITIFDGHLSECHFSKCERTLLGSGITRNSTQAWKFFKDNLEEPNSNWLEMQTSYEIFWLDMVPNYQLTMNLAPLGGRIERIAFL